MPISMVGVAALRKQMRKTRVRQRCERMRQLRSRLQWYSSTTLTVICSWAWEETTLLRLGVAACFWVPKLKIVEAAAVMVPTVVMAWLLSWASCCSRWSLRVMVGSCQKAS
jgi:hypothetical protein